jgi:hypothetical protein
MNKTSILKRTIFAGALFLAANTAIAADVGVSISVGQPGFYGQIDIGDYPYPQPRVIYKEPIIVHRQVQVYEPMYLRVPPGHYKNWKNYCKRYNACGRQVYFVQDGWYRDDFAPRYRERHGNNHRGDYDDHGRDKHDNKHGNGKGKGRD